MDKIMESTLLLRSIAEGVHVASGFDQQVSESKLDKKDMIETMKDEIGDDHYDEAMPPCRAIHKESQEMHIKEENVQNDLNEGNVMAEQGGKVEYEEHGFCTTYSEHPDHADWEDYVVLKTKACSEHTDNNKHAVSIESNELLNEEPCEGSSALPQVKGGVSKNPKKVRKCLKSKVCHKEVRGENQSDLVCGDKKQLCSQCGEIFHSKVELYKHTRKEHSGRNSDKKDPKQCFTCGKMFNCLPALKLHEKRHTDQRNFPCPVCGKKFFQRGNRNTHMRRIHNVLNSFVCKICDKVFTTEYQIKIHMSKDHKENDKEESCVEQQGFTGNDESELHIQCILCSQGFRKMIRYLYHLKSHLTENLEAFDPGKKQDAEAVIKEHEVFLTKSKTYQCDQCHAVYFYKADYIAHQKSHAGTTFKCAYCDRTFFSKTSRHDHQLTHAEHFDFVCTICKKPFMQERRLLRHCAKEHPESGIAQSIYIPPKGAKVCPHCNKEFGSCYNLIVHMRTHTSEQPYACVVCHRTFSDPSNLIHHGKRAHPECPKERFRKPRPKMQTDLS